MLKMMLKTKMTYLEKCSAPTKRHKKAYKLVVETQLAIFLEELMLMMITCC
jgi:hypothetical protein